MTPARKLRSRQETSSADRRQADPPLFLAEAEQRPRVRPPLVVAVIFMVMAVGAVVPRPVRIVLEFLSVALLLAQYGTRLKRHQAAVLALITGAMLWWTLGLLHPNVPTLAVGVVGWRKSIFALVGLGLGATVFARHRRFLERLIVWLLTAGIGLSIVIHIRFPGFESGVARAAGDETGTFGGVARLQGIYPGPFHVALAASFLVVWSCVRLRESRFVALTVLIVGLLGVHLAQVRSSYVALALATCVFVWRQEGTSRRVRTVLAVIAAVIALSSVASPIGQGSAFSSFSDLSGDDRLIGRFETWEAAGQLIASNPFVGHGPGSAGDTMAPEFIGADHITSHNVLLKWAVEGGAVGLLIVVAALVYVGRPLVRSRESPLDPALAGIVVFMVFGATGAIVEANPVSFFLATLIGAASAETRGVRVKMVPSARVDAPPQQCPKGPHACN